MEVYDDFASEQAKYVTCPLSYPCAAIQQNLRRTASAILSAVKGTLSLHGPPTITVVGHSLGAALALLDAVYLKVQLGSSVNIQVVGYGMPRVGNQAFANWVDHNLAVDGNLSGLVTRINNKKDPVPTLPALYHGFHHASGEVHITDSGTWESCPGKLFLSLSSPRPVCGHVCFDFRMLTRARPAWVTSHCRPRQRLQYVQYR